MTPVLTRSFGIYLARNSALDRAPRGSQKERDLLAAAEQFKLCSTVDSEDQALAIFDVAFQHGGVGGHFYARNSNSHDAADVRRVGSRIEEEYQKIITAKPGEILKS